MHGLRPEWGQVDDGKPAVSKADARLDVVPNAFSIGPAMRDRVRHPAQIFSSLIAA